MWSFFSRDSSKDFNYDIADPFTGPFEDISLWKLHAGKRKGTGELVSIFVFDVKNRNETQCEIAKASLKRLKTLRHPNITLYLDSLETDKVIYLVTEYVEPLGHSLDKNVGSNEQKELEISWGLHQVAKGLNFLNNDCSLVHNNVCIWSTFRNQAGDWKLGCLDYMCQFSNDALPPVKILPQLEKYDPPEKNDPSRRKTSMKWSVDMWGFGCLIWEVFNGPLEKPASLKKVGKIPKSLSPQYCELVSSNPSSRPNPAEFILVNRNRGGFFHNSFIDTLLFLEEIQIKDSSDKTKFFNSLTSRLDSFPPEMCKYKILPQLVNAYEFGNAGSAVLSPMFKLSKLLEPDEFQKKIVPCVVKLFSSTDRATRARLLQQMENFVDYLQPTLVNSEIFPQVLQGFMDTNPTIRENTVKAMLHLAPKLNYNNLNVELMKHFARLQARDDQGGIRTNTTVCLGKIAHYLHPQVRQKMLIAAFTRAMRDVFPPAKTAGILALAATQIYFPLDEIASKVIPALSFACIDSDKSVRDQAFKTIKGFIGKLETVSEDPSLAATIEKEVNSITSPTVADTAASWAGWAVTSITSKFYKTYRSKLTESSDTKNNLQEFKALDPTFKPEDNHVIALPSSSSFQLPLKPSVRSTDTTTKTAVSAKSKPESFSDSDDDWNDDWGQMDNKPEGSANSQTDPSSNDCDGWPEEDWGSLEDTVLPSNPSRQSNDNKSIQPEKSLTSQEHGAGAEFVATDPDLKTTSTYNWDQALSQRSFFDLLVESSQSTSNTTQASNTTSDTTSDTTSPPLQQGANSGWDGTGTETWESWETADGSQKSVRTDVEERRKKRQKEIKEKRVAKQASGAMKLGKKKELPHE